MMLTLPEESLPMREHGSDFLWESTDLISLEQGSSFEALELSESAMIWVNPEDHRVDV